MAEGKLKVYSIDGKEAGEARIEGSDVIFPSSEMRWTWVLDARHEPYTELPLQKILERADAVRKRWVLVSE